ncbi:MAG: TIGR03619 family F420-dependent LLM class oxidoreductase [Deltaproteobacteria bacterium]|nr:TIGR03619 family F420-dependent LLM class oxidoreductase [Deltaproteobacteria bacterium]
MRFGIALRTMGKAAVQEILRASAALAESARLDTLWIPDHIAIPPDDAEGSDGRYLDPLASLSWLAAATDRIRLGTAVLILPYRPALPTAKAIATIQELSGGRLELGVGVGWMEAEFRAVGVDRRARGRISDEVLSFLHAAFDGPGDRAVSNGQSFLFRPNPAKPRIWIGGAAPHALVRAARFGDGWMPMTDDPEKLREPIAELVQRFAEAGRGKPGVTVFGAVGRCSTDEDLERLATLESLGVDEFIQGARYDDLDGFRRALDPLLDRRDRFQSR